jgi:hypothetical protein
MLPPGGLSLGGPTKKTDHIIWGPSIPPIAWTELHQTISVHGILIQASQLRNGIKCTFAFGTDEQPFSGSHFQAASVSYLWLSTQMVSGIDFDYRTNLENR